MSARLSARLIAMSQYLIKVGLDVNLHYYGKTHAASTVFADSHRPPFEISDLDRH